MIFLYEIPRIGKSIETASKLVIASGSRKVGMGSDYQMGTDVLLELWRNIEAKER